MSTTRIATADALGAAIRARSTAQISALYSDDIVVWHGSTGKGMGKKENMAMLAGIFELTAELEYRNIRRFLIDGGIVQQHQVVGKFSDGKPIPVLEVCMIMKMRDGLLTHIDEYFDSQCFAEVFARLATSSAM
jgi:ketosteroid isomerase-like protein